MPFALLIAGIVLVTAGVRGTTTQLTTLVKNDFTGQRNFAYWLVAILVVGSIGYVEDLRPLSRMFLALLLVVLFLSNRGFFQAFNVQAFTTASQQPLVGAMASAGDWASAQELLPTTLQPQQQTVSAMIE